MPSVPEYNLPKFTKKRQTHQAPAVAVPSSEELTLRERLRQVKVQIRQLEDEAKQVRKRIGVVRAFRLAGGKAPTIALYALRLENGCYYVGATTNVERRYAKHVKGQGAAWTKRHKPIEILEVRHVEFTGQGDAARLEDDMTIEYALKYGSEHVRGGGYCQTKYVQWPDVVLENEVL
jgi:predicted GIY-YIG superfamily endonuclease